MEGMSGVQIGPGATVLTRMPFSTTETLITDITNEEKAPASLVLDAPFGFASVLLFVEVHDCAIGLFLGEEDCHGTADAAVSTGEERYPALKLARTPVCAFFGCRLGNHLRFPAGLPLLLLRRLLEDHSVAPRWREKGTEWRFGTSGGANEMPPERQSGSVYCR